MPAMSEKEHLIQALINYQQLSFHLDRGSPGFRISGWQEQFLNAIARLASDADEREKREAANSITTDDED